MSWFVDNWDKLLAVFLAVIVGGITGFFAAVIALKSEISELRSDIHVIKTKVEDVINPKLNDMSVQENRIISLEMKMVEVGKVAEILQIRTNELFQKTDSMLIFNWQKTMIIKSPQRNSLSNHR